MVIYVDDFALIKKDNYYDLYQYMFNLFTDKWVYVKIDIVNSVDDALSYKRLKHSQISYLQLEEGKEEL